MRTRISLIIALACGSAVGMSAFAGHPEHPEAVAEAQPAAPEVDELAKFDSMRRFGIAEAPAKTPGAIRVATYNVENLFDDVDDPALSGDNEDIDDEKPEHELRAVARAIQKLDADVLCVQEIESYDALVAFRDAYLSGMGYEHVVSIDAGTDRGIEQGVLSRFPLGEGRNWPREKLGGVHPDKYGNNENWNAGQPLAFRRSPMLVDVTVPAGSAGNDEDYAFTVAVVHHKSGRHAGYWREAEAKKLASILTELSAQSPSANVLVLGDFNAEVRDESVKTYFRAGFTDVFESESKAGDAVTTHESGRRIDLILANRAIGAELVAGSGFVLGTPARPKQVDWRTLPTFEGYAADHYPVAVDLRPVEAVGTSDAGGQTP
ncbi:MAG: hypothetical protein DHS20C14_02180 [Phycisphaeraceae bacterium]|nr:MAG: hypothetical protein DHS20C14_02180 [Phycisphaeraceae bacterium]